MQTSIGDEPQRGNPVPCHRLSIVNPHQRIPPCIWGVVGHFSGRMRQAIVILIQQSAPARPQCFADDDIWHSWLKSAHDEGLRIVRRVDRRPNAKYRSQAERMQPVRYELLPTEHIPYCDGCLYSHQKRMQDLGRCHPCQTELEDADAAV